MADFDFPVYLQRVYPRHRYHVQRLAGGLVNYTVRARREDANEGLEPSEDDEAPSAMVLKQAPPFVAALGADAPFSQQRQVSISLLPVCTPQTSSLLTASAGIYS